MFSFFLLRARRQLGHGSHSAVLRLCDRAGSALSDSIHQASFKHPHSMVQVRAHTLPLFQTQLTQRSRLQALENEDVSPWQGCIVVALQDLYSAVLLHCSP